MASAAATVTNYYDTLRRGEPLDPFFHDAGTVVKVGVSETLSGYDAVAAGLREQTRDTTDWVAESRDLRVTERDRYAWFADAVRLAWTERDTGNRHDYDTRWTGTLERHGDWGFVAMHVSAPHEL